MATFRKKILLPDRYKAQGKWHDVTEDRMRDWVGNFNKLVERGYSVPAPYRHDKEAKPLRLPDEEDAVSYNNGGWWDKLWLESDGSLWGRLTVDDKEKADKLRRGEIKEVSPSLVPKFESGTGDTFDETIMHIALCTHPIAPNQESFEEELAASLVFSREFAENTDTTEPWEFQAIATVVGSPGIPTAATGATLEEAMRILKGLGLNLPSDTTEGNFLERVVTAGLAVIGAHGGEAIEQPVPPVSMSQSGANVASEESHMVEDKDNDTAKAEPELTAAQKSAIAFAQRIGAEEYRRRVNELVNSGRIPPKIAKDKLGPLLDNLRLEFSETGEPIGGQLDVILSVLESIPEASSMVTRQDIQSHGTSFSIEADWKEETADDLWGKDEIRDDDDADKLLETLPGIKSRI